MVRRKRSQKHLLCSSRKMWTIKKECYLYGFVTAERLCQYKYWSNRFVQFGTNIRKIDNVSSFEAYSKVLGCYSSKFSSNKLNPISYFYSHCFRSPSSVLYFYQNVKKLTTKKWFICHHLKCASSHLSHAEFSSTQVTFLIF